MSCKGDVDVTQRPRIVSAVRSVIEAVQGLALIGIVSLILCSIILRNFFNFGLIWVFEVAGLLMVTMVFLGAPKNLIDDSEIRVNIIENVIPKWASTVLKLFGLLLILAVSAIFAYFTGERLIESGHLLSPTLQIPHLFFYSSVFIGPFIAIFITLWRLVVFFRARAKR